MSLIDYNKVIMEQFEKEKTEEETWFANHPPLKEFSIMTEGDLVHFGVWQLESPDYRDDLIVITRMSNGKYHFKYKVNYDKRIIKELMKLIPEEGS